MNGINSLISKSIILEIHINENGCPIVEPETRARATVKRHADADGANEQFIIEANRSGLITLANWMLSLADKDSKLDHQHFDNEVDFGVFRSDNASGLILQRTD